MPLHLEQKNRFDSNAASQKVDRLAKILGRGDVGGMLSRQLVEMERGIHFRDITKLLEQTGAGTASPPAPTATSVQSARGSTLAKRRRQSGLFVIPRIKQPTPSRSVNVPSGKGVNIVI